MTTEDVLRYLRKQALFGDEFAHDAAAFIERELRARSYSTTHEASLDLLVPPEDPHTSPADPIVERNYRAIRVANEIVMLREQLKDAKAKASSDDIHIQMVHEDGGEINPSISRMGELAGKIVSLVSGNKLGDIMNALNMAMVMAAKDANIPKRVLLKNTGYILSEMYDDMRFIAKKDLQ